MNLAVPYPTPSGRIVLRIWQAPTCAGGADTLRALFEEPPADQCPARCADAEVGDPGQTFPIAEIPGAGEPR